MARQVGAWQSGCVMARYGEFRQGMIWQLWQVADSRVVAWLFWFGQGSQGALGLGNARLGTEWRGSQGEVWHVEFGQVRVWQSRRGKARLSWYGKERLGKARDAVNRKIERGKKWYSKTSIHISRGLITGVHRKW